MVSLFIPPVSGDGRWPECGASRLAPVGLGRRLALGADFALAGAVASAVGDDVADQAELDQRIAKLITQLGDDEYDVRQRAQKELEQLGFAAFDALTEAEENSDVEIATQARYLARLIRSHWINDRSPQEVRKILANYETEDETNRLHKMQALLQLEDDAGIEWLCRLLRFEQTPKLAKQMAILIITQDPQPDDAHWPKRAATLTKNLERSRRPAALWLRSYVEMRGAPEKGLSDWIELVAAEKRTLEEHPQQTDSRLLMQMLRIEVVQLERLNRKDDAMRAMHEMVGVERGETLAELVSWLAKRHAWEVIDEVATRFASSFDAEPQLLYTLAQALAGEGKTKEADETANRALKINPEQSRDHWIMAQLLQYRGLTDWLDREYLQLLATKNLRWEILLDARREYAESLHDRGRDGEAADVAQVALDLLDGSPELTRQVKQRVEIEQRRARAYYFRACDSGQKHDFVKQRELLEKAIQEDPNEADVLIALYHLPDQTPDQRQRTMELIASAVQFCHNRIDEDPDSEEFYNQLAWLVGNTEGDFDEAIRLSEKSVELIKSKIARDQPQGDMALRVCSPLGRTLRHPGALLCRQGRLCLGRGQAKRGPTAGPLFAAGRQQARILQEQTAAGRAEGDAMKRLTVGGVELNVVVRGTGLPLLLAHAFPLDHSMWSAQIERFGSQAQVIAPDLRGFGSSGVTVGTVSMEQMADDLAAILDQLGVVEPVVLAGLSMGGYVAWQFARKYPERLRALVLANTRATADTPEARQGRMNLVEQVLSAGPAVVADAMLPRLFTSESFQRVPGAVEFVRERILLSSPEGIAAALRGLAARPDMSDLLGRLRVPTLAIAGSDDVITPADEMRKMAAAIPQSELVVLNGVGHLTAVEAPNRVQCCLGTLSGSAGGHAGPGGINALGGARPGGQSRDGPRSNIEMLRNLEQRLRLHNRVVVGKRVESLHQQAAVPRLDIDIAQRPQGHPAAGIEAVQHPLPLAVVSQLVLEGPKDLGFDRFELEIHLIAGTAAAFHPVAAFPLQLPADQPAFLGQRVMGRRGDLRQRLAGVSPGDHVAGAGDVDGRLVVASLDRASAVDLEQLGVQSPSKQLKDQLGDFGSNGQHVHDPCLVVNQSMAHHVNEPHYKHHAQGDKETFSAAHLAHRGKSMTDLDTLAATDSTSC